MTDLRVPVTLLTGFLGAGKTTLLNAVLSDSTTGRVAVIVNEFGEAGLDHDLIETSSDDISLMKSGCLCCTLRGELSGTILGLLERREAGEFDFERIVIETTGLAEPGPIIHTLVADPLLARTTRTDGIVTVVDTVNAQSTLDSQFEAVSQVAMADLIVLSKTDLATPDQKMALQVRLNGLNSGAKFFTAVKGSGVVEQIWNLSSVRHGITQSDALAWAQPAPRDPFENLSGFGQPQSKPIQMASHDSRIVTASIVLDEPVDAMHFGLWVDYMIENRGPQMLRAKGIVFIDDMKAPFVFHGVQTVFEHPIPLSNWTEDTRQSRIVMIARDMSVERLEQDLERLRSKSSPPKTAPQEKAML